MRRKTTADALIAATRERTGCVVATDRRTGAVARLFLVQGEAYGIGLDGYTPDVLARLRAADALAAEHVVTLAGEPQAARIAVERGWVSVDALADIHTELLVAGLGAVVDRDRVKVEFMDGLTTDLHCAIPAPMAELLDLAALRRERTAATWRAVTPTGTPRETGLSVGLTQSVGDAPELVAFLTQCAQGLSIDDAASRLGLTRAEAVHLAALVVLQHRAVAVPVRAGVQRSLAVPEQFGEVTPDPQAPAPRDDIPALKEQVARLERELDEARTRLAALGTR